MTIIELRQFNILRYFFLPLMVVMLVNEQKITVLHGVTNLFWIYKITTRQSVCIELHVI